MRLFQLCWGPLRTESWRLERQDRNVSQSDMLRLDVRWLFLQNLSSRTRGTFPLPQVALKVENCLELPTVFQTTSRSQIPIKISDIAIAKRLEPPVFHVFFYVLPSSSISPNWSYQNCHESEVSYVRITSDVSCSTSSCLKRRGQDDLQ